MKKILLTLIAIIVGLFVIISAINTKSDYSAERELWHINRELQKVSIDPKSVPDQNFAQISNRYKKFVKKYKDSSLRPLAYVLSGRVHVVKEEYDQARAIYEEVAKEYADNPDIAVQAVVQINETYRVQEDWVNVLKTYKRIMRDYPKTEVGLRVPILIAKYYANKNDLSKTRDAFNDARSHYRRLIKENPDSKVEFDALRSISISYIAQQVWEPAVTVLGEVLDKFADSDYLNNNRADKMIKTINTLSITKIKDYDLPIGIYQKFIDNHPEHKFNPTFKTIIDSLNLLKERSANIEIKK